MSEITTDLIQELIPAIEQLAHNIGTEYPQKKVLHQLSSESDFKNIEVGITECRVIDCIERNKPINAIRISSKINVTKSGISKTMTKLKNKGLVNTFYMEGNQKEVYYTLTNEGVQIYQLHNEVYNSIRDKYASLLSHYSKEELICINNFIHDILKNL